MRLLCDVITSDGWLQHFGTIDLEMLIIKTDSRCKLPPDFSKKLKIRGVLFL